MLPGRLKTSAIAAATAVVIWAGAIAGPTANGNATPPIRSTGLSFAETTNHLLRVRDELIGKAETGKLPPALAGVAGYTGNDTCQWANDGECDDPGIGTGACRTGTDYSDCWRIATNLEDDSCQYAKDGECDEPHFGTGACAQGTDRTDCGEIAFLRNQDDSCNRAFNGVCNEPGTGDGTCAPRTDRSDCLGRERPMTIADHYFGFDDRVLFDTTVFPWTAVGALTAEDGGGCSATLVGDNILVTAAHCIEVEGGVDARSTFETAFGDKSLAGTARVTAYLLSPDRARDRANNEEPAGTDWALLRIDQPLGERLGYVGVRPLVGQYGNDGVLRLDVVQAGYSWDTGVNLSGNVRCAFLAVEDANRVIHNCDTTHGDSGSPLMVRDGDAYFIVATDSTFRTEPGEPAVNVATRSDGWVGFLADFAAGRIGETNLVGVGGK